MPFGNISDRIRHVRGKLKKAEFADALGISHPNLSRYESGRTIPAEVLQKIADYGGVSVKWLLTGKEEDKDLGKPLLPDQPSVALGPGRPCEIEEFLFTQVLRAFLEFNNKNSEYLSTYGFKHMARLITAVYNHCAREQELPSLGLFENILTKMG